LDENGTTLTATFRPTEATTEKREDGDEPPLPVPVSLPSLSLTPTAIHRSCEAAQNGDVFVTRAYQTVPIQYELLITTDTSRSSVTTNLDDQFRGFLALALVNCSAAESSPVQGVATSKASAVTGTLCEKIQFFDSTQYVCFQVESALTLYLSESSAMTTLEIQDEVYRTFSDAINGPTGRRLGQRQLFESNFTDPKKGIIELYFLNETGSGVNQLIRTADSNDDNNSVQAASAVVMLISVLGLGFVTLIWCRRRDRGGDDKSKAGSLENSWLVVRSPRASAEPYRRNLGPAFQSVVVEAAAPSTPSQLSSPQDTSNYSAGHPATTLFEAYEAAPMEDGNQLFYRTVTTDCPVVPRTRIRTQEITTVPHDLLERSIEDELPFDELAAASSHSSHNIPNSPASIDKQLPTSYRKETSPRTPNPKAKPLDPPPSMPKTFIDLTEPAQYEYDYAATYNMEIQINSNAPKAPRSNPGNILPACERQVQPQATVNTSLEDVWSQIHINDSNVQDSFSVTGFLDGHCAAMEGFYNPDARVSTRDDNTLVSSKKKSPASVAGFWSDARPPDKWSDERTHTSSVDLWKIKYDENSYSSSDNDSNAPTTNEEGKGGWSSDVMSILQRFSRYGVDQNPKMATILGTTRGCYTPTTASVSTDKTPSNGRGRDRTVVIDATNSHHRRQSLKMHTISPRNPPGRCVIKAAGHDDYYTPSSNGSVRHDRFPPQTFASRGAPVSHLNPRERRRAGKRDSVEL
jgi:hypothetical protein